MEKLLMDIDELIALIEKYTRLLLSNESVEPLKVLVGLSDKINVVFPALIASYEREELKDYQEEQSYWISQLGRITDSLSGSDRFLAIDVLYQETRANLLEYQSRFREKKA